MNLRLPIEFWGYILFSSAFFLHCSIVLYHLKGPRSMSSSYLLCSVDCRLHLSGYLQQDASLFIPLIQSLSKAILASLVYLTSLLEYGKSCCVAISSGFCLVSEIAFCGCSYFCTVAFIFLFKGVLTMLGQHNCHTR